MEQVYMHDGAATPLDIVRMREARKAEQTRERQAANRVAAEQAEKERREKRRLEIKAEKAKPRELAAKILAEIAPAFQRQAVASFPLGRSGEVITGLDTRRT